MVPSETSPFRRMSLGLEGSWERMSISPFSGRLVRRGCGLLKGSRSLCGELGRVKRKIGDGVQYSDKCELRVFRSKLLMMQRSCWSIHSALSYSACFLPAGAMYDVMKQHTTIAIPARISIAKRINSYHGAAS